MWEMKPTQRVLSLITTASSLSFFGSRKPKQGKDAGPSSAYVQPSFLFVSMVMGSFDLCQTAFSLSLGDSWVSKGQEALPVDSVDVATLSGEEESRGGPAALGAETGP